MDGSGTQYNPRTVEEVFRDFKGRRAGMIKALTDDVEDFFQQCDPEKENLCLYGFPSEQWEVNLPAEEVPPELPKPALGINFARDGMQEKDWLALVAVHSDAWLLAVAFYFSARFGFDRSDRKRLLNMINEMSTIYEVVTGAAKKQVKEKSSVSNHSSTKSKPNSKDTVEMNGSVLALTDNVVIPVSAVLNAIEEHGVKGIEQNDPLIITQALSLKQLPITSSSMDAVVFVLTTHELPGHELLEEMFRAVKPGGAVTFQKSQSVAVNKDEIVSTLKRRLLLAGFLDAKVPLENLNSFTVRANKPSWKIGSSFTIKKSTKSLPKVQIDDDLDLIDEDSLLTEEDLKKPQLLPVDDCEVGSTRKACKNCSCGRAEAVEKVEKLGLTMDQIENPQSSCGSCGLGDAFRCGLCPYKGLPPFKLGEKVSLAGNFLASDF